VDLSGIIFVVLALAWAVYLIPKALKHHDEIARTRSIDRFSTAMRVLARREPVNRRDSRLVVTPARAGERVLVPSPHVAAAATGAASAAVAAVVASAGATESEAVRRPAGRPVSAQRAAARAAAKRRRRVLLILIGLDVLVAALAGFALVPWWSVAVPVVLTVAFLVLCRTQVRRQNDAQWSNDESGDAEAGPIAPRRAIRVEAPYGTPTSRNDQGFEEVSPDEDTVAISAVALGAAVAAGSLEEAEQAAARAVQTEVVAVSVPTADGGSLWDPLPVTLPTYVGKPRAARTVRTIDLSQPGTWTSGRTEEDTRLVEEANAEASAAQEQADVDHDEQRAVGS
jgi:hypothetical protein